MGRLEKRKVEPRRERFVIMLTKNEVKALSALAEAERLPVSTAARRLLLDEAEKRRLSTRAEKKEEPQYATQ